MFQGIILKNLIEDKKFARRVLPHLKEEYFETNESRIFFRLVRDHIIKYGSLPTPSSIKVEASTLDNMNERSFNDLNNLVDSIDEMKRENWSPDWLVDTTESFCQERALTNAILDSVGLIENKQNVGNIPEMVRKALQVSFSNEIGLEMADDDDVEKRWDLYHRKMVKIPTGIDLLDSVTGGGYEKKSLIVTLGQTNAGKTAQMVNFGANAIRNGFNVLYVTLEMSEEKIIQRFEANFFDNEINDISGMSKSLYLSKIQKFKKMSQGRLIVKEFPTSCCDVNRIRGLLDELAIKKEFKPDVILVDYLNLMNSIRVKGENMYSIVKSIAEELRGLAVEGDYCIVSGTQITRSGFNASDIDLTDTSESIGLPATVDFMLGTIFPDELREQGIQIWKVLKNRFGGIVNFRIPVRVEFAKSRFLNMADNSIANNDEAVNMQIKDEERRRKKRQTIIVKAESKDSDLGASDILDMIGE